MAGSPAPTIGPKRSAGSAFTNRSSAASSARSRSASTTGTACARSVMRADRFDYFAAIDWSGAAGERHAGIALAICETGDAAPTIVRPAHRWSRAEIADWLLNHL